VLDSAGAVTDGFEMDARAIEDGVTKITVFLAGIFTVFTEFSQYSCEQERDFCTRLSMQRRPLKIWFSEDSKFGENEPFLTT
jgi:hypothetical protein